MTLYDWLQMTLYDWLQMTLYDWLQTFYYWVSFWWVTYIYIYIPCIQSQQSYQVI